MATKKTPKARVRVKREELGIPHIESGVANVADLVPYAKNSRKHSERQIDLLVRSIKEFGFTNPVLVWRGNEIIAGHARVIAAEKAGLKKVPVRKCDHLTDTQRRALVIADNKLAVVDFEFDTDILNEELAALHDADYDLSGLGFDEAELPIFDETVQADDEAEDDTPSLPKKPKSKHGDIYQLGEHRLMCGSSTERHDVMALMGEQKAALVFTDPPYNVAYEAADHRRGKIYAGQIKNDEMSDSNFFAFIDRAFKNMEEVMAPFASVYVCHPDSASEPKLVFEKCFAKYFHKSCTIVWAKNYIGAGFQDYRSQHEPILYGWKPAKKGKHFFNGGRGKSTLWKIGRDSVSDYKHPTQKPVALPEEAILNSSNPGDLVLDLFGGSGSTLIAAEKTKRKAYLMELDPLYVDVILQRYEQYTGKKPVKIKAV